MDILSYAMARSGASADIDSIIAQLPKGLVYKGAVDYYSNLPNNANVGDTYTVKYKGSSGFVSDGNEYAWGKYNNINQWILIGVDEQNLSVNVNNLTQTSGDLLLFNCGTSTDNTSNYVTPANGEAF